MPPSPRRTRRSSAIGWRANHRLAPRRPSSTCRSPSEASLAIAVRGLAELPFGAPHFVESVLADNPGVPELRSTLDPALQRLVERRLRSYVERQRPAGIRNGAVLLVDHGTMAVKAAVGSA